MKLAVQQYNFRATIADDFEGTMRKLAAMGFQGVEFVRQYGGLSPEDLVAFLKEIGMECAGCMLEVDKLQDLDYVGYAYAKALNSPAVTTSQMGDFTDIYKALAEKYCKIAACAAKFGLVYSYHNHWMECNLIDGKSALDRILELTASANVFCEPDVCWLFRGKVDPVAFIKKYASRIRQVHIKDILNPEDPMTTCPLGQGVVPIKEVVQAAKEVGIPWVTYEQDNSKDPMGDAQKSIDYIKSLNIL